MYVKIFSQIYDGTLGTKGPWQALVTFQQLLVLADKHGQVDMTPQAIARRTTIPLEIIEIGLRELVQPDPESRTPDEDGRRIVPLSDSRPWGWRIVNHAHYRKMRSEEERRDYHKLYQRERRAKEKDDSVNSSVNKSTPSEPSQPIAVSSKQNAGSKKQEAASRTTTTKATTGGAQKPRPDPYPWMEDLRAVLKKVYGKAPTEEFYPSTFAPLIEKHGLPLVVSQLEAYCTANPLNFFAAQKFATMFGMHGATKENGEAARIWSVMKEFGFTTATRYTIDGDLERAAKAGKITDPEGFRATILKLDREALKNAKTDAEAERIIEKCLIKASRLVGVGTGIPTPEEFARMGIRL